MNDDQPVRADVVIADYAGVDPLGKVNVIGAGVAILGYNPIAGVTAPFTVWVRLSRPDDGALHDVAVEISLQDANDDPVSTPTVTGESQRLRIGQVVQFRPAAPPGITVPIGSLRSEAAMIFNFSNGIQLAASQVYRWVVHVDTKRVCDIPFFVAGVAPGPVLG